MKLAQSEQQLRQLQQSLTSASGNGPNILSDLHESSPVLPSMVPSPLVHHFYVPFPFHAVLERDTCQMEIPQGHNPRKNGWKEVYVVMSYQTKKLMIYNSMNMEEPPITTLEFRWVEPFLLLRMVCTVTAHLTPPHSSPHSLFTLPSSPSPLPTHSLPSPPPHSSPHSLPSSPFLSPLTLYPPLLPIPLPTHSPPPHSSPHSLFTLPSSPFLSPLTLYLPLLPIPLYQQ